MPDRITSQTSRLFGPALIVLALLLHLHLVWTIAIQPLDVNNQPAGQRSIVWPLYNDTIHRPGPGADFFAIYHAGRAWQSGASLYADAVESGFYYFPFRYLPVVAQVLGGFFIQFEPFIAYRLWILTLELVLGCLLVIFARRSSGWLRYFGVCVLLLSTPYFLEVYMGQFTFMTTALLAMGLLLQEESSAERARLAWTNTLTYTGAVLLKLFPIVTAPAFVRKKVYWLPLGAAILLGLAVSLPYFMLHPGELGLFYARNFGFGGGLDSGNYGFVYLAYLSAKLLNLKVLLDHWDIAAGLWRVSILGLTSLAVLFNRRNQVTIGAVAMLLAHFLSYSEVWEHHISGVVVLGVLLLWVIGRGRSGDRSQQALVVACLVVLALPTPFALLDPLKDPQVWDPLDGAALPLRWLLVFVKAFPTGLLYLSCLTMLGKAGFTFNILPGRSLSRASAAAEDRPDIATPAG